MATTYKVHVDIVNRVPADKYKIELYKATSSIPTAVAELEGGNGINSHTFVDLVNDSYKVRIGHVCSPSVTIWTDQFPVSTTGSANTQCKKITGVPTGGVGQVSITTSADPSQGVEVQVFRNAIPADPPGSANSDGKILVKGAYFAAPTVPPLIVMGLTAGNYFLKTRAVCNVTATDEVTGGASMVIIYSDWANYEAFTTT